VLQLVTAVSVLTPPVIPVPSTSTGIMVITDKQSEQPGQSCADLAGSLDQYLMKI